MHWNFCGGLNFWILCKLVCICQIWNRKKQAVWIKTTKSSKQALLLSLQSCAPADPILLRNKNLCTKLNFLSMCQDGSLISRPLPDFISQLWRKLGNFLHSCEIKPGSGLGTRLLRQYIVCLYCASNFKNFVTQILTKCYITWPSRDGTFYCCKGENAE